ncbi:nucleotide pyrophosphatase/phosphodiesterase family protein [Oryzihumus sp.]|uniref:alkaline phosphatase family protein n=1 Tax=Oryzihumus sp. TaxID=1968903 RepID=UPI002ED83108
MIEEVLPPRYDGEGLAAVLPAVARSLGVPGGAGAPTGMDLPEARRAVVVLVDGLGYDLLRQRSGHAPFLRGLLPAAYRLTAGFPSTTATSMATFGTGLPPGAHGLVGYEVLVPGEDRLLNELSWEDGPDPLRWQPSATVFERAQAAGVDVTRIGPGFFDGSGLTNAAVRGGSFRAATSLDDRVDAALAAVRASRRALVYLYWGELDKVGHVHGCQSWEWGDELEAIDGAMARLAASVPPDTAVLVTADHGMVDAPHALRIDLGHDAELAAGIRHVGGEARSLQLYCEPGAAADVVQTWRGRLSERAWVLERDEAVAQGWFGPVAEHVLPRIGDVVVPMRDNFAIVDSRTARPQLLALLGLHGSLTPEEVSVPLLRVPARDNA